MNNKINTTNLLNKIESVLLGNKEIFSDKEYDAFIDTCSDEFHDNNVVSIPNPDRAGVLDALVVYMKKKGE